MLLAAKTYALISEYALICDMRLITREYGINIMCVVKGRLLQNYLHEHLFHELILT